jgi:competence protein ComEC
VIRLVLLAVLVTLSLSGTDSDPGVGQPLRAASSLEFAFVDVEGGAATLIRTPAGESILIDSGFPGERDAGRIARAARELGVARIDHYVTTHWHRDHVGGVADLARQMPIGSYYGHAIPDPLPPDIQGTLVDAWRQLAKGPTWLRAGDRIPLQASAGTLPVTLDVIAADALGAGEQPGSPPIRACDRGHASNDLDTTDNARSLGFRLSHGAFDFFAGGDLTWNIEHKLVCPRAAFPVPVDVYLVNHHGADSSNNPALIQELRPSVAIVNNGPRKGAEPRTMRLLLEQPGPGRVFQLHRNVREGAVNAESTYVANDTEDCNAAIVRVTLSADAERFAVAIPAKNASWDFESTAAGHK